MRHSLLISIAAVLPGTYAIAHAGAQPTGVKADRALLGISPATTQAPSPNHLEQRQYSNSNALCGWLSNDFESSVTCSAGLTCQLYKSATIGMAGCCLGSNRQNCNWLTSCVDYRSYTAGGCGVNCLANSFVHKCTNSAAPYCVTYTWASDNIIDYACGTVSTVLLVRTSVSDALARVTTSVRLTTVSAAAVTGLSSSTSADDGTGKKTAKLAVGVIIGIVIVILFVLFLVAIGIFMCIKRKKKQKQLAANAQLVAANQANRQSQYQQPPPPPQNMQQSQGVIPLQNMPQQQHQQQSVQGGFAPPMPPQSPQPAPNGYYTPPAQQKFEGTSTVHEFPISPISNPPTPAPAYNQPFAAPNAPPMPQQPPQHMASPVQQYVSPVQQYAPTPPLGGAHEVDAISVPHAPRTTGQQQQPLYEMGQGR